MSDDASTDAPDDLGSARRTVLRLVAAVGALVFGVLLLRYGDSDEDEVPSVASVDADDDTITVAIGPEPGTPLSVHVTERAAALRETEGRRVAVVSLTGYSSVETAEDLVGELDLDSFLVTMVGDEPRRTDDVAATRRRVVADARAQLEELEGLAPTVEDDPDYSAFYASEIERYRLLLAEHERDDIVHGVVVVGSVAELRALASRASVRLVDVGRSSTLARDASVRGLRPEEEATAGEPMFRPA